MTWSAKHIKGLTDTGEKISSADGKEISVWEFTPPIDDKSLSEWATHFRNHYCRDYEIDYLRRGYGFSKTDYLNNIKFPDPKNAPGPSIRSGDFGEILVADYLAYILGYWVPRTKYEDKTVRNESKKGCDILGFHFIEEGKSSRDDCLAIFEAKAQFTNVKKNTRLQDAVDGSSLDILRKAESLNAVKQRLFDKGKIDLADKIDRFQNPVDHPHEEVFGAVAILTNGAFDSSEIAKTITKNHPNHRKLMLIVIRGDELMQLAHSLYERAANEA